MFLFLYKLQVVTDIMLLATRAFCEIFQTISPSPYEIPRKDVDPLQKVTGSQLFYIGVT